MMVMKFSLREHGNLPENFTTRVVHIHTKGIDKIFESRKLVPNIC